MSLLRVIPSAGREEKALKRLLAYIRDPAKQVDFQGNKIPQNLLTGGWGVDIQNPYNSFILPHISFAYPGHRIFYHVLIDFTVDGMPIEPLIASCRSNQICEFLTAYGVQYFFGVHTWKGEQSNPIFWSHCHLIVNAIYVSNGKKFHIGKKILWDWKHYANKIFENFNLDKIKIYSDEV